MPPLVPNPVPRQITISKSRIIVVETVYHQSSGLQPTAVESRYSHNLKTDEQVYGPRRIVATEEWKPLDVGWVKTASLLILSNEEGKNLQVNPTQKEREDIASRVVHLAYRGLHGDGTWMIHPGHSFRGCPNSLRELFIRCQSGQAECFVTVFPE